MATLQGFNVNAGDWDFAPPGATGWTFSSTDETHAPKLSLVGGALTNNLPISETPATKQGYNLSGWTGDYLNRIHIAPTSLSFGNIIGPTVRTFEVWNAYQVTKQLTAFTTLGATGVVISPTPSTPQLFAALQSITYTLTADQNGPPLVQASYTYSFGSESRVLTTSGRRLVAWTWRPNWANEVLERLGWKTDVLVSYNAREQRRRLRSSPRRAVEFDVLLEDADRRTFETAIAGWQARVFAVPLWWDGQKLAADLAIGAASIAIDTTSREFKAGGIVIVSSAANNYEVLAVSAVSSSLLTLGGVTTKAWPTGTSVYPAVAMRLAPAMDLGRFTENAMYGRVQFLAVEAADVTSSTGTFPTYLGYPVVEAVPVLPDDPAWQPEVKASALDDALGFEFVDDEANSPIYAQTHGWLASTQPEKAALRALLYYLQGRYRAAWFPTWAFDLKLVANVSAGASNFDVEWVGYTQFGLTKPARQHVRIERTDGTVVYHKITGSVEVSSAVERLTVGTPIVSALTVAACKRISFMALMRGASDGAEISHWTGDSAQVQLQLRSFVHDL